ncbi:MAG: glycosyltransferase family 4 protein [Candidatus Helarchaeota archaeon]
MRICYILGEVDLDKGGAEVQINYLIEYFKHTNHHILLLACSHNKKEEIKYLANNIIFRRLNLPYKFRFSKSLVKFLVYSVKIFIFIYKNRKNIDIIHSNNRVPTIGGILSKFFFRIPLIYTEHFSDFWFINKNIWLKTQGLNVKNIIGYLFYSIISKFIVMSSDYVVCLSNELRKRIISSIPVNPNRIVLIFPGIDYKIYRINVSKEFLKSKFGIYEKNIIFFAGRLVIEKGLFELIKSFKIVNKEIRDTHLIIAGTGYLLNTLRNLVKKINLEKKITFTGFLNKEKLVQFYKLSSIFCLPSYYEITPIVLLEAMASNLPIIASNIGGIPELIENEKDGILIPPNDIKSLSSNIIRLLKDRTLYKKLSNNAYNKIKGKFYYKNMVFRTIKLYQKLINKKKTFGN